MRLIYELIATARGAILCEAVMAQVVCGAWMCVRLGWACGLDVGSMHDLGITVSGPGKKL